MRRSAPEFRLYGPPLVRLHADPAGWHAEPLAQHTLWAVLRGKGSLELDGKPNALRPGIVCLFRPGQRPLARPDAAAPLMVYAVSFAGEALDLRGAGLPPVVNEVLDMSCLEALARMTVTAWERGDPRGRHRAEHGVEQIVLQLVDEEQRAGILEADDRISRLVARMDAEPALRMDLRAMAATCHMSASTFHRVFRAMTGHSPGDYLLARRIGHAKHLLRESAWSLGEIALFLGYGDVAFFSRQFRDKVGCPPGAYRHAANAAVPDRPSPAFVASKPPR